MNFLWSCVPQTRRSVPQIKKKQHCETENMVSRKVKRRKIIFCLEILEQNGRYIFFQKSSHAKNQINFMMQFRRSYFRSLRKLICNGMNPPDS
jgi:hypothetical protein